MGLSSNGWSQSTTLTLPKQLNGTKPFFGDVQSSPQPGADSGIRGRPNHNPVPIEATVYWWRAEETRAGCTENQFGNAPAIPVRFRCIGTLMPKYPKRFRVELAQSLDLLPELNKRELKQLGVSLAAAVSRELDVEVAPFNGDVIDLTPTETGI